MAKVRAKRAVKRSEAAPLQAVLTGAAAGCQRTILNYILSARIDVVILEQASGRERVEFIANGHRDGLTIPKAAWKALFAWFCRAVQADPNQEGYKDYGKGRFQINGTTEQVHAEVSNYGHLQKLEIRILR